MNNNGIINALLITLLFGAAGVANAAGNQSWDGVYGGIQGGWGFDGKAKLKFPPDAGSLVFAPLLSGGKVNTSPEGGAWGLHLGENRQFGNWVIGLEGSFNWADIDDSNGNAFGTAIPTPTKHKTSLNWFGALTPRVGYAIGNWLPYVKAGLAIAEYENYFTAANGMRFKRGHIHNGWTAGLGVEYALAPAWVLGVEYNYSNFNSRTYGGQGVPDNTWATQYGLSPSSHAVMARLSYNFGAQPKNSGGSSGANVDWDGLYGGIHAVWGFDGDAKLKFPRDGGAAGVFAPQVAGGSVTNSPEGGAWGFHLGQNRRVGDWVVGLEGAFSWADFADDKRNAFSSALRITPFTTTKHKTSVNWMAALTLRMGYALGNWLPYVKAGLAVAEFENSLTSNTPPIPFLGERRFKRDHIHNGWTAGVGVEYAMQTASGSWLLGLEYNYYDFNSKTYGGLSNPDFLGWPVQFKMEPKQQTLGARVSYKF